MLFSAFKNTFSRLVLLMIILCSVSVLEIRAQDKAVQLFAHRAGAHEQDENTLQAFQNTYDQGLRGFETDIRMTKDGELVIFHDASLERITGQQGIIEEMTAAELRKIKTKKGNPLLFLDELLDFLEDKPGVYLELEMKTNPSAYPQELLEKYCDQLYKAATSKKPESSTYLFTSFDKRPLQYIKATYPDADMLFITSSPLTKEVVEETLALGVNRVGCNLGGTSRKMVQDAQAAGIQVSLWPGHSVEDFLLGVYLGADYLCSDVPVQVLQHIKEKMPWVGLK
jgi:glycerophosphoryl diester phosphodiesterase